MRPMTEEKLSAQARTILGKKVKSLRKQGQFPAVVYGKSIESTPVTLGHKEFVQLFKRVGESGLIALTIDDEKPLHTLITSVTYHPVTNLPLHADFKKVSLTEKTSANVPVVLQGESPAVEDGEGILLHLIDEMVVHCLPQDIPHEIIVDITGLAQVDDAIYVKDLPLPKNVEIELDPEELVVKVDYAQQPEAEEESDATEAELIEGVQATEESDKPETDSKENE